jgi:purine-binding chemotaxis protein CheW
MEKEAENMEEEAREVDAGGRGISGREGKHLCFSLEREEYGIGILKVREIIGMMRITPVPQTPKFVKGVINLRGKVIPVIDLRLRFGMNSIEYSDHTCIIDERRRHSFGQSSITNKGGKRT